MAGIATLFEGGRSRFDGGTVVLLDANRKPTAQLDGMALEHPGGLMKKP